MELTGRRHGAIIGLVTALARGRPSRRGPLTVRTEPTCTPLLRRRLQGEQGRPDAIVVRTKPEFSAPAGGGDRGRRRASARARALGGWPHATRSKGTPPTSARLGAGIYHSEFTMTRLSGSLAPLAGSVRRQRRRRRAQRALAGEATSWGQGSASGSGGSSPFADGAHRGGPGAG